MKCLIIAAGKGSRLQQKCNSKPLIPILGIPLIERVIRSAIEAGADEFYVVTGYQGKRVRSFLDQLSDRIKIHITSLTNEDWEKENGLSVLKAQEYLQEPFLLLMADHLFDPALVRKLIEYPLANGEIALGVDKDIRNPLVDMEDVTRVKVENEKINIIGKGLTDFNGFDTGIFKCSPAIFDVLKRCRGKNGDTTLSGMVRIMAEGGHAKGINTSGFWIDVDDPAAFRKAEKALLDNLRDKLNDGPISRYLNRPVSVIFSRRLAQFDITPNQISLFSFLCSVLAAGLFTLGGYLTMLMGGILAQFASIIDGSDGEVARLKFQSSDYGGWFDAVLDRYSDAFLLFGLTWHVYLNTSGNLVLWIGFAAIIGSFMLSYTADKYDSLMRNRISKRIRLGRDTRVFVIFLGALFNQAYLVLVIIAVVMNIETMRRVIVCRGHG
ncbi:bifunctional IPC transferase and DIPP synthase [bacterium BMS3Abin10]|nr:bifunctional IPC transferase and DIPP synthase [bacterium BMS3Abin10]HDH08402.1 nucleotidyl transferase [Gammaproteobacteria bacterium]